jgi:beta-barrel assembly-enhancing protease
MIRITACLALLFSTMTATAQNTSLPDFGEANAVSLNQEYYLGRAWLMSFRRQAPVLSDPLLEDYVEELVFRLAQTSQLRERRLELVLVKNKSINAFAVPGGVVGVHNGLILKAESESQLASVLGHELAHLSQRHFSRGQVNAQVNSKKAMASLLVGLVAVAAGAGEAGMATIMGGQAAGMDSSLRYSRLHEQEADRLGIQNLAAAGLDPRGAAGMFEVMQEASRNYGASPPAFLLTHPLTQTRIADARNRAQAMPRRMVQENPEFQLMRARVAFSFYDNPADAVSYFRDKRAKRSKTGVADQYGLILALTQTGEYAEARKLLQPMREFAPANMVYALAETDIDIEEEKYQTAIAKLEKGLQLVPANHPITMQLAKAYFKAGRYEDADLLLSAHTRNKPTNAHLWYVLSEVQGLSGNTLGLHQSRAEYFALNGAMKSAMEQLNIAMSLATDNVTRERIQNRINRFNSIARALG